MYNEIASGGGGIRHPKRIVALASVIIIAVAFATLIYAPQSDTSEASNLTTDAILNTDTISVSVDENGLNDYISSQIDMGINPSTIPLNDLERFFTVTASNTDGSVASDVDFYLYLGEPLKPGQNDFHVRVLTMGGELNQDLTYVDIFDTNTQVNITGSFVVPEIDRIEASPDNITGVFSESTTEEEMRNKITVEVYFEGNDKPVEIRDYVMIWSNLNDMTVTISYGEAQDTVSQKVTELEVDEIRSASVIDTIFSSDNDNRLKDRLQVIAVKNDGKQHILDKTEYNTTADLYTGTDGTENNEKVITVSVDDANVDPYNINNVSVTPSTPQSIYGELTTEIFYAYSQPDLSQVVGINVTYVGGYQKNITSHYGLAFYKDGNQVSIDKLEAGNYDVYLTYQENSATPVRFLLESDVYVSPFPLSYPTIDGTELSFNTQKQRWEVYTDHPDAISAKFECSICGENDENCNHIQLKKDETDGKLYIYATDAGDYTVEFTLSDTNSYEWADGLTSHAPYPLHIIKGIPIVSLSDSSKNGWIYGNYNKLTFTATLYMGEGYEGEPVVLGNNDIKWSSVNVWVSDKADGSDSFPITNLTDWDNFHAGTWYVRVSIDVNDAPNLTPTTTEWGQEGMSFSIDKNTLTPSVADGSYGESGTPSITLHGTNNQNGIPDSDSYTYTIDDQQPSDNTYDAGEYNLEITLSDEAYVNFDWTSPVTGDEKKTTTTWTVQQAIIDRPDLTPDDDEYIYNGSEKTWTLSNTQGTDFGENNFKVSFECRDGTTVYDNHGMALSGNTISAVNAGTYTITIGLSQNSKGTTNYVWADNGSEPVSLTATINKKTLDVTAQLKAGLSYGGQKPNFDAEDFLSEDDGYNLTFDGWAGNDGDDPKSQIESLNVTTDYEQGSDVMVDGQKQTFDITISDMVSRNYSLNDTSEGFTIDTAKATITKVSVDPINYRDLLPSLEKHTITIDGLVNGEDLSSSRIEIVITTSYTPGDDARGWDGDESQGYEITLTATSDNYDMTVNDELGYMVVKRLVAMVNWEGGDNEFPYAETQGNPPGFTVTAGSYNLTSEVDYVYTWLDSNDQQITENFEYGEYTLKLSLMNQNYTWPESVSNDGIIANYGFTITHIPLTVEISISQREWTYGFTSDEIKDKIKLIGTVSEDIATDLNEKYTNGYYVVYYIDDDEQYIENPLYLNADSTYGIHIVFGDIGTYYVTADIGIEEGIIVGYRTLDVGELNDVTLDTYNDEDKTHSVTIESLNGLLNDTVIDGTATWTIKLDGTPVDAQEGKFTLTVHDAGTYTVSFRATADNHTFQYGGGAEYGSFTITVPQAAPKLTFDGDTDGTHDNNATYTGTYGQTGFKAPEADVQHEEQDEQFDWTFRLAGDDQEYDWEGLLDAIQNASDDDGYLVTYEVQSSNVSDPDTHNYYATGTLTFHVSKATISVSVKVDGKVELDSWSHQYDGISHTVTLNASYVGTSPGITWTYTLGNGPQHTYAGDQLVLNFENVSDSCTIQYTVSGGDNYKETKDEFEVIISRAPVSGTLNFNDEDSFTFQYGAEKDMSGSLSDHYETDDSEDSGWAWTFTIGTVSGQGFEWLNQYFDSDVNCDAYSVSYRIENSNGNYVQEGNSTFDVEIAKAPLTFALPNDGKGFLTYGDALDLNRFVQHIEGLVYEQNFADVVDGSIEVDYDQGYPARENNAYVTYTANGTELRSTNYDLSELTATFTVSPLDVEIFFDTILSPEYRDTGVDLYKSVRITSTEIYPAGVEEKDVFTLHLYTDKTGTGETTLDDALYTVENYYIIPSPTDNYTVSYDKPGELHVGKRTIGVTYTPDTELSYNGKPLSNGQILEMFEFDYPDYFTEEDIDNFPNYVVLTFDAVDDADQPASDNNPMNAGTYTVGISVNSPYYDFELPGQMRITINPADYGVELWFPTDRSIEYDGNGHDFPLWVRVQGDETGVPLKGEDWNIVIRGEHGGDPLTVTYYVDGVEQDGYPVFYEAKEGGAAYVVTVSFEGDDNYNTSRYQKLAANLRIEVFVTPATNNWALNNAGTGWLSGFQYTDFEYSQAEDGKPTDAVGALFGTVETRFYKDSVSDDNYMGDGWIPDDETVPGTYHVVVSVKDNKNYTHLEPEEYSFTVNKLGLTVSLDPATTQYIEGQTMTTVLKYYNPELMEFMVQEGEVEGPTYDDSKKAYILSTESPGIIIITLRLINPDCYEWKGSDIEDLLSMRWTVTEDRIPNQWTVMPAIDDWTYGLTADSPEGESLYGEVVFTYKDESGTVTSQAPTSAGQYTLVADVTAGTDDEGRAYGALHAEVGFTILEYRVPIPGMITVDYTGEAISVPFVPETATINGQSMELYTVEGESGTDVGDYYAILKLADYNFVWQDGTDKEKSVMWRIVSGEIPTYDDFAVDTSPEVYTGSEITKNVICHKDGWEPGVDYKVEHRDNKIVGEAKVVVSGTTSDGTPWQLEFPFKIVKASPVLTFVNEGFTSHEGDGTFELLPYVSDLAKGGEIEWTSSDESVATVDNGVVTLRGLGTATITAKLLEDDNWNGAEDSYTLTVNETQTEIVVVPGPDGSGGTGGDGDVIYIPTVITKEVDGGISDTVWLIILACTVIVLLTVIWLLWNRRVGTA